MFYKLIVIVSLSVAYPYDVHATKWLESDKNGRLLFSCFFLFLFFFFFAQPNCPNYHWPIFLSSLICDNNDLLEDSKYM